MWLCLPACRRCQRQLRQTNKTSRLGVNRWRWLDCLGCLDAKSYWRRNARGRECLSRTAGGGAISAFPALSSLCFLRAERMGSSHKFPLDRLSCLYPSRCWMIIFETSLYVYTHALCGKKLGSRIGIPNIHAQYVLRPILWGYIKRDQVQIIFFFTLQLAGSIRGSCRFVPIDVLFATMRSKNISSGRVIYYFI